MAKLQFIFIKLLVWLRYKMSVEGLEQITQMANHKKPIIFVSTHPSLMDPVLLISILWERFRPAVVARDTQIKRPVIGNFLRNFNPISVPDMRSEKKQRYQSAVKAVELTIERIKEGGNILLWPTGKLSRDGYDYLEERSALYAVIQRCPEAHVVAVRSQGLWGGYLSWYNGPDMPVWKAFCWGLLALLVNGFIFTPRRKVHYELKELTGFEGLSKQEVNQKVETYFNGVAQDVQLVPLFWWQKTVVLPAAQPRSKEVEHGA